ncbi:hypothetical protein [Streptomyces noursei]|uniref:hypothetical protein n=1 Tax=Streptomyces noursei TaxID=1971 RepID=UPI00045EFB80|nr:hypothetical protein [Streptomyces noursei]AIA06648.1 hypothetical protein DC74_6207 [Streptomyces noursei]
MPDPAAHPFLLANEISRQLNQLADHLARLPPDQATQVIAHVVHPDHSLLDGLAHFVATGSRFTKNQAEQGALPPEVALALGRAANEIHAVGVDLGEHHDTLQAVSRRPHTLPAAPPAPAPLVVRRRR